MNARQHERRMKWGDGVTFVVLLALVVIAALVYRHA